MYYRTLCIKRKEINSLNSKIILEGLENNSIIRRLNEVLKIERPVYGVSGHLRRGFDPMMNEIKKRKLLIAEYSAVHVFYWCCCCFISTYAAFYLQAKGFSNTQLGLLLALANLGGFFLAPMLASVVDRSEKISVYHFLYLLLFAEAAMELLLLRFSGYNVMTGVMFVIMLTCSVAINPLVTSLCFEMDHTGKYINFGFSRCCGAIAYTPVTLLTGRLCKLYSEDILSVGGLIMIAAQLVVLTVILRLQDRFEKPEFIRNSFSEKEEQALSLPQFIRSNRTFFIFCCGTGLLNFSLSLIGSFQINLVENAGGTANEMGIFNAISAAAEIPMMLFYTRLTASFHCSRAIRFASLMYVVRMLAYAFADTLPWMYVAAITETFSYALMTPALVDYVSLVVPYKDMAKGQTLSFALLTLGSVFASQLGGIMFDTLTVRQTMLIGAAVAVAGAVICWKTVDRKRA